MPASSRRGWWRPTACPGVFATLDAGAEDTLALYFMYDVKHYDPAEWSSPPLEGRIVDRPGEGKAIVGRGAVNQKGPETAFLAALHAFKAAGVKLPVNLVLVAEGEEEIASPHFSQIVTQPDVRAALEKAVGDHHSFKQPVDRGIDHLVAGRERGGRASAGRQRRKMGTRAGKGHPFEPQGQCRQSSVAPDQGAQYAGCRKTGTRRQSTAGLRM